GLSTSAKSKSSSSSRSRLSMMIWVLSIENLGDPGHGYREVDVAGVVAGGEVIDAGRGEILILKAVKAGHTGRKTFHQYRPGAEHGRREDARTDQTQGRIEDVGRVVGGDDVD